MFFCVKKGVKEMKCKKCGSHMEQDYIGFSIIYECSECYNVEEVEVDEYEENM